MNPLKLRLVGTLLALCLVVPAASAATISVGPYTASTTMPFVVPIRISGAVDLTTWTFDLSFDASDLMINTACDPFTDPYCSLLTGPINEGSFFTATASFPTLFVPGFILTDASLDQTGQLLGVYGAWQDPLPGVSGDGILAFIEFVVRDGGDGTTPITIDGPTRIPEPGSVALIGIGLLALLVGRRRWRATGAALGAVGALACTTPAVAQTVVNGPYYATPSWDQTLPPASRFLVLSNFGSDAVLDRETGLVWQRSSTTTPTPWFEAYDGCLRRGTGGRNGWRLPTAPELLSLFDVVAGTTSPLPAGNPFHFPSAGTQLWTDTSVIEPAVHYQVQYFPGSVPLQPARYSDSLGGYALCVRGPAG